MAGQQIVIRGITLDGKKFRPSDWAERLYHAVATYGPDGRPKFPPFLKIQMDEGMKCIVIDLRMQDSDPLLFDFLVGFGQDNELTIQDEEGNPVTDL